MSCDKIADANHPLAGKDLTFAVTVLEGGVAPSDSAQQSPPVTPSPSAAPEASSSPAGSPQDIANLPFIGSQVLRSDPDELPRLLRSRGWEPSAF